MAVPKPDKLFSLAYIKHLLAIGTGQYKGVEVTGPLQMKPDSLNLFTIVPENIMFKYHWIVGPNLSNIDPVMYKTTPKVNTAKLFSH